LHYKQDGKLDLIAIRDQKEKVFIWLLFGLGLTY